MSPWLWMLFFVVLPVGIPISALVAAMFGGNVMGRGDADSDISKQPWFVPAIVAVATVVGVVIAGVVAAATASWVVSSKLNDGLSGVRSDLRRIEIKENANAAKIQILAMDLPAGKKRDLLETVDKMEAILPANSQMAVKMVLEGRTSDMATLPKAGAMDFNNLEQK